MTGVDGFKGWGYCSDIIHGFCIDKLYTSDWDVHTSDCWYHQMDNL